jgi:ABC-type branched-subunit amino acid transport system ATPase component
VGLLELKNVTKTFGGVRAVSIDELEWGLGQVYGLIGPNGAGKSTLVNIITGVTRPDNGTVTIDGVDVAGRSPHRIAALGLSRTFQTSILMEDETVLTNVLVGDDHARRSRARTATPASGDNLDAIRGHLDTFGILRDIDRRAGDLSYGVRRLVEVVRALVSEARLILLDEPAAGLPHADALQLGGVLRDVVRSGERSVVLIEHNVKLVLETCDQITVMVEGSIVERGGPEVIRNSPAVIESYLGRRAARGRNGASDA